MIATRTSTKTRVDKILAYAEDWPAFVISGFAVMATASGNNLFTVVMISLASICKAIPSMIAEWKTKKIGMLEDWMLFVFAVSGLVAYLGFNNLDLAIYAVGLGMISKTTISLVNKNRKEMLEDLMSACFVTSGVLIYVIQGDPTPNPGLILPAISHIAKTSPSLMMGATRSVQGVTGAGIGLVVLGYFLVASVSIPTLAAGTGCDGIETNFRVPLTVGFYLSGGPDDIISKVKRWHFLGGNNPYTDSLQTVQSFRYDNATYYKYPPNGTNYDIWVDIGHYDSKGKFIYEESSAHCSVSISPQPLLQDLHFLYNNPDQLQGYVVQGNSVGFDVSLQHFTPLTWSWNDNNPNDAKDEINTYDTNPSHKYADARAYTVTLIAGQDTWYFPVLVIPSGPIAGNIVPSDLNGSQLFRQNDTLNFSFITKSNLSTPNLPMSDKKYSWIVENVTEPVCTTSKFQHKFTSSGNFLVKVAVMDSDCTTPWLVTSTTITILDPLSVTTHVSSNNFGAKFVTVDGAGFTPGDTVQVMIDNVISTKVVADCHGHFTTSPPFAVSNLPNLAKHTIDAESIYDHNVNASTIFSMP